MPHAEYLSRDVLNVRPAPVQEQVRVPNFGQHSCMLGEINEVLFAHNARIACPKN